MAKVSVIIPVYNIEKYLKKCLDSVTNQTFSDIEIICVNDGSTDNSLSILEEYAKKDNRIKIINKENGGLSSAWNAGLNEVSSEYVTFVDGDDWIDTKTFKLAYEAMINNKVDYVCWGANIVPEYYDDKINEQIKYHKIKYSGIQEVDDKLISNTVVTVWSKLYKTAIIKDKHIYFPTNSGHDDNAFWLMYSPWAQKGYYIPEYLYNYVQRKNSIMGQRLLQTTKNIFDNIILIPPVIKYYNQYNLSKTHYNLLIENIKTFFFNDYNFMNGKYKKEVLDKIAKELKNTDLGILNKDKFIKALISKNINRLKNKKNYTLIEKIFSIKNENSTHKVVCILGLKAKIKRKKETTLKTLPLSERVLSLEINQIIESGLLDNEYYIRNNPNLTLDKLSAIKDYLTEGWQYGRNPSDIFDGTNYIQRYPQINYNPLLYFLNEGRYSYKDAFLCNIYDFSEEDILEYNNFRNNKPASKVVYTCITNDYDDLEEIKGYTYINPEWDYICFTDNQNLIKKRRLGIWQIRPLQFDNLDSTRNNRWHKINPHLILPEYEESVYIDANINILTDKLFKIIDTHRKKKKLMFAEHASTICLYKEFEWVLWEKVDKQEIMTAHLKLLQDSGFPKNYGMPENNLIYRQHNKPEVISIMNDWWYMIENYTKRDQLSLPYVLWKHNILTEDVIGFPNTRVDYKNFCTFVHKGKR